MPETPDKIFHEEDGAVAGTHGRLSMPRALLLGVAGAAVILAASYAWHPGSDGRRGKTLSESLGGASSAYAATPFDMANSVIPHKQIRSGGVQKDGIPALSGPPVVPAADAAYLQPSDRVIGVTVGRLSRAYPLRVMSWHEIVNDQLGETPIAVVYCPLCDSSTVFNRRIGTKTVDFGVSGRLYNSNVLMYDRLTNSLWSQLMARGVTGPAAKRELSCVPLEVTTWHDWQRRFPQTDVLSTNTGHNRDYAADPYDDYFRSSQLWFPVNRYNGRLAQKQPVLGVWTDDAARAYPLSAFDRQHQQATDTIDGRRIALAYNADAQSLRVVSADPGVQWMYSFWFAWYAFHPETDIYAKTD